MIVVLGTYPRRLSKLTMKVSIMPMKVEDEGEWREKKQLRQNNTPKTFPKSSGWYDDKKHFIKKRKTRKDKKGRKREKICQVNISFLVVCFL